MIDTIHLHLDFMSETGNSPDHETGEIGLASEVDMAFRGSGYRPDIYSFEELRSHFEKVLGKQNALNLINVYPFKFPGYQQFKGIRDDWWSYDNCVHDDARRRSYINCHFGNLRITVGTSFFYDGTVYNDYIDIEGSLQRWYYEYSIWDDEEGPRGPLDTHHLISPLPFEVMKDALDTLGSQLGIEIKKATIRRLDFGLNIITEHRPQIYTDRFIRYKEQRRSVMKGSLYFGLNNQQTICWYDKTSELKKHFEYKGITIPNNILRYEVRLMKKKSVSKELKINPEVRSLYDIEVYLRMIEIVETRYKNIVKEKPLENELGEFTTARALGDMCIAYAIKQIGLERLLNKVDEQMKLGTLSPQQPSRIRNKLMEVYNKTSTSNIPKSDIIDELDAKVSQKCEHLKNVNDSRRWSFF